MVSSSGSTDLEVKGEFAGVSCANESMRGQFSLV